MNLGRYRRMAAVMMLAVLPVAAGCAKKAQEAPPTPPPAPPTQTTPPAPATETPRETPPAPSPGAEALSSNSFQPVFFDYDSYSLRDDSRAVLDANAKLLRDNPGARIVIEGHCDERGTAEYNQALGERRAQAARDYLAGAGIDGGRMQMVSYGKERPFETGHDEAAWARNRRAHFVLQ